MTSVKFPLTTFPVWNCLDLPHSKLTKNDPTYDYMMKILNDNLKTLVMETEEYLFNTTGDYGETCRNVPKIIDFTMTNGEKHRIEFNCGINETVNDRWTYDLDYNWCEFDGNKIGTSNSVQYLVALEPHDKNRDIGNIKIPYVEIDYKYNLLNVSGLNKNQKNTLNSLHDTYQLDLYETYHSFFHCLLMNMNTDLARVRLILTLIIGRCVPSGK